MNYGEGLEQTSAGALKPGSGRLTAVDKAFSHYDTCPRKFSLAAIEKALNSCRNARRVITRGVITRGEITRGAIIGAVTNHNAKFFSCHLPL